MFNRAAIYSELFLRENPLGQNVNCTEVATFDCCVDAITGNVQVSYWTTAETLKVDRTQKSARTLPSVSVPPCGDEFTADFQMPELKL